MNEPYIVFISFLSLGIRNIYMDSKTKFKLITIRFDLVVSFQNKNKQMQ